MPMFRSSYICLYLTEPPCSSSFNVLQKKQPLPPDDAASKAKYMEVARRLEEGLFKTAISKVSRNISVCVYKEKKCFVS